MDSEDGTGQAAEGPAENSQRQRWWLHLILLGTYPIAVGILPSIVPTRNGATLLPGGTLELFGAMVFELLVFAVIFGAAWLASRAGADQLLLRWNDGAKPVLRGFLYSIVLRIGIAAMLLAFAAAAAFGGGLQQAIEKFRPRTEVVVDPASLTTDPVYFLLTLTLVSFVVGGLREELWRAGMIAGLRAVFPEHWRGFFGNMMAVGIAAVIFGLGHFPQGWGGAAVTALLGFGLGVVMVYHRSIWEAVLAHGFFNATSFLMLYYLARAQPDLLPTP